MSGEHREYELTRSESVEQNLSELKEIFRGSPDNIYVRGSIVRGDRQ